MLNKKNHFGKGAAAKKIADQKKQVVAMLNISDKSKAILMRKLLKPRPVGRVVGDK